MCAPCQISSLWHLFFHYVLVICGFCVWVCEMSRALRPCPPCCTECCLFIWLLKIYRYWRYYMFKLHNIQKCTSCSFYFTYLNVFTLSNFFLREVIKLKLRERSIFRTSAKNVYFLLYLAKYYTQLLKAGGLWGEELGQSFSPWTDEEEKHDEWPDSVKFRLRPNWTQTHRHIGGAWNNSTAYGKTFHSKVFWLFWGNRNTNDHVAKRSSWLMDNMNCFKLNVTLKQVVHC